MSRFAEEESTVEGKADSKGHALPITAPATGNTDKFLITSLRFISIIFN